MIKIFFGFKSFLLKKIEPALLEFPVEEGEDIKLELRQKYFHIYWIPIFPTNKIWIVRKNGKEHEFPEKLLYKTEGIKKPRAPWYSLLAPIVVLISYVGVELYYETKSIKRYLNTKKFAETAYATTTQAAKKFSSNQLYRLSGGNFFKVERIVDNENIEGTLFKINNYSAYNKKGVLSDFSKALGKYIYLNENNQRLKKITVSKEKFRSAIPKEYYSYFEYGNSHLYFKKYSKELFSDKQTHFVNYVYEIKQPLQGPIIDVYFSRGYYGQYEISLSNFGDQVEIKEFNSVTKDVSWEKETPIMLKSKYQKKSYSSRIKPIKFTSKKAPIVNKVITVFVTEDSKKRSYFYRVDHTKSENSLHYTSRISTIDGVEYRRLLNKANSSNLSEFTKPYDSLVIAISKNKSDKGVLLINSETGKHLTRIYSTGWWREISNPKEVQSRLIKQSDKEIRYSRAQDGSEEWFKVVEGGVEHGITVQSKIIDKDYSLAFVQIELGESVMVSDISNRDSIVMVTPNGELLKYHSAKMFDANGNVIEPGFITVLGHNKIGIGFHDENKIYPITIRTMISDYRKAKNN